MSDYEAVPVKATLVEGAGGRYLQLVERLSSRNSYLSAQLRVSGGTVMVRVWTMDNLTLLDVLDRIDVVTGSLDDTGSTLTGDLLLRDARELRLIPPELIEHALASGRDVRSLTTADLRYAVTYIDEASDPRIRAERIDVVVRSLPLADGRSQ